MERHQQREKLRTQERKGAEEGPEMARINGPRFRAEGFIWDASRSLPLSLMAFVFAVMCEAKSRVGKRNQEPGRGTKSEVVE